MRVENEGKVAKRRKKPRRLYEQYLADSGSDNGSVCSSIDTDGCTVDCEEFTVGMNINILIHQTVQNMIQSVCLEDYDGLSRFGDYELTCFAAAVKHNSSILSLQIRYLDASDISLVPLCEALQQHPCLRALDLSGTRGSEATSAALRNLVCSNPSIIFARIEDTIVSGKNGDIIQKAMRFNAMVCADPTNNPFQLGLLRKISSMEEEEHSFNKQLQAKPWLFEETQAAADSKVSDLGKRQGKRVAYAENTSRARIGTEVCAAYVQGRCPYGSRCKFFHPERTAALRNATSLAQHDVFTESANSVFSANTAVATRQRLQSRLRPSKFTFSPEIGKVVSECDTDETSEGDADYGLSPTLSLWALSFTIGCCCVLLATRL